MKKLIFLLFCGLVFNTVAYATDCETVKDQISEKIKANGVAEFTLEAVDKGSVTDKKVVGVCGGGTKDIVYERGANSANSEKHTQDQDQQQTTKEQQE